MEKNFKNDAAARALCKACQYPTSNFHVMVQASVV